MRHLLFHVDGPNGHRPFDWSWITKWCGLYRVHPVAVDPGGHVLKGKPPQVFRSLQEAVTWPGFQGHAWVWLDPAAERYLAEVEVPSEDVVFCLGDDTVGFNGFEWEGPRVKLRSRHPDGVDESMYASVCAVLLLQEVYG